MPFQDKFWHFKRKVRRRLGTRDLRGTIKPWDLTEDEALALRSEDPGPVETAFFEHEGRVAHKWIHYLPIYDRLFSRFVGKAPRMLEIGVNKGGSLQLWRKVFGPEAVIYGIDIDPLTRDRAEAPNEVRIGSQDDPQFLRDVVQEMGGIDIVLDDGSHVQRHIISSFETLFPLLDSNGVYAIEDLQTSYWPGEHEGGWRRKGTAMEYLKAIVDDLNAQYHWSPHNALYRDQIDEIRLFPSMAAIEKCPSKARLGHLRKGRVDGGSDT